MNCSRVPLLAALTLAAVPACGDDAPATSGTTGDETSSTSTDASSSTTTGTTTGQTDDSTGSSSGLEDGSSSGEPGESSSGDEPETTTGGDERPALGQTSNVLCEATLVGVDAIIEENGLGAPDPMVIEEAYLGPDGTGAALQQYVQTYGGLLGRVEDGVLIDDAFILAALTDGSPEALIDVETRIYAVMTEAYRYQVNEVSNALPDANRPPQLLYAQWDDAYCYWNGLLRLHAQAADALGVDVTGDRLRTIEEDIDYGFEWGHANIEGPDAPWAIDEYAVPAAKQIVEKSLFRIYDRLILDLATTAASDDDPRAARRALGLFDTVEHRFAGRNTPGIAIVRAELDTLTPANIDVAAIEHEMDITWIKRTRRYTDAPVVDDTIGTAGGFKSATEGRTYAKIALPRMVENLQDFDGVAHLAAWDALIEATEADDATAVMDAAMQLTDENCAYHTALGLPDCTADDVE